MCRPSLTAEPEVLKIVGCGTPDKVQDSDKTAVLQPEICVVQQDNQIEQPLQEPPHYHPPISHDSTIITCSSDSGLEFDGNDIND